MAANRLVITYQPLEQLLPYARNARTHSPEQVELLAKSIQEYGWTNPVLLDGARGIIAGHGRVMAAKQLGLTEAPCIELSHLSEKQRQAYILADNKLAERAGWDADLLRLELGELAKSGFELELTGFTPIELSSFLEPQAPLPEKNLGSLAARFLVAPFTVFNAREGWWQTRKRAWMDLGIRSELGRGDNLLRYSDTVIEPDPKKRAAMQQARSSAQANQTAGESYIDGYDGGNNWGGAGTSVFDPVLAEIAYRWWCPPGGQILDSFAGGSVRGIVASRCGRHYTGIDLRDEQVRANDHQAREMADAAFTPQWIAGDSADLKRVLPAAFAADFLFTCPPYFDLERYSEDPHDLSNAPSYESFLGTYRKIITAQAKALKADRFAAIVVGDIRDKAGVYRGFVSDTIRAFQEAGLELYNEAILVTPLGSLPIRIGKQFGAYRKLGKTHQNVLVFVKGDWKRASAACGELEIPEDIFEGLEPEEQEPESLVPSGAPPA